VRTFRSRETIGSAHERALERSLASDVLLLRNGTVITGDPPRVSVADVLIAGDAITAVGKDVRTPESEHVELFDCTDYFITPGFINGHIHLNQLLNRGFLDERSTEDLLADMHARHDKKSDDDRYWASLLSLYEGLRSGTTYFSAFATSTGLIARAMTDAGVRGTLTVAKKDQWWGEGVPPEQRPTSDILGSVRKELERWQSGRISLSIGAASDRAASQPLLEGIRDLAAEYGTRIFIHVAEGSEAVRLSKKHRDRTPVAFLSDIGFLGENVTLVHVSCVTDEDIEIIASARAGVCHCPISNAKTVAGTLPLRRMREANVPVCFGTDSASTNNTNNILLDGFVAAMLHKTTTNDAVFPTSEQVFALLTCVGAKAVGYDGVLGEVAAGFKADLVLWPKRQTAFLPNMDNPVSALVYCPGEVRPERIYVGGELVLNQQPTRFAIESVIDHVSAYRDR
jgi:5-methylthioadenosine/S-adenosylhomocysteine deaminase